MAAISPNNPTPDPVERAAASARRAGWFTAALLLVVCVGDGWSGRPAGLRHELLLLPFTAAFVWSLRKLLFLHPASGAPVWTPRSALLLCAVFQLLTIILFLYESRHFAAFGYHVGAAGETVVLLVLLAGPAWLLLSRVTPWRLLATAVATYSIGILLAIACFPLNYFRSDMLPVIGWADAHLLQHINPYATMYIGNRVYDFPYLPGMLVAYLPFAAAHLDLRFASIAALGLAAWLLGRSAAVGHRMEVVSLLALFLLDPFLQYRHDLYLQPHWLTLVGAFLFMQRGRYLWGAFVLGLGMAIYQFSWIILPFLLLNAFWRRGWLEAFKLALAASSGALLLAGPFLHSALARISSNTVGQWGHMQHALADPMNLSYWITYFVRPDKLLRLQAVLMVAIFVGCVLRRRCSTLEDTLRWTVVALTVFILCNSIVDGYFFLMLLVPMLLFTLVANGWLQEPLPTGI